MFINIVFNVNSMYYIIKKRNKEEKKKDILHRIKHYVT